jgi:quinol---cytochrome-c reductase cytochrome c subunit
LKHRRIALRVGWQSVGGWIGLLVVVGLATAVLSPLAVLAQGSPSPAAAPSGVTAASVVDAGRSLFRNECASCHGMQGQGTANGPSLDGAGAAAADFYLSTGRMPLSAPGQPVERHPPQLDAAQMNALVAYVASLGNGPAIPQVAGGGDLSAGSQLFIANCAACHGATGSGNAIGGGARAADLSQATATQIVEAMRIGPGPMPKFAFSSADESAIVAYVQELQHRASPGGLELGGLGPVAEGFVAVVIGLVLLVLAAMYVGRQSHEGEPPSAGLP